MEKDMEKAVTSVTVDKAFEELATMIRGWTEHGLFLYHYKHTER